MQDKIVVDIGKVALKLKGDLEPYQLFIQNPFPEKSNYPVILGVFNVDQNGDLSLKYVDIENSNKNHFQKYGFRKGSSRGGDITFSTKISEAFGTKLNTLKLNQLPGAIRLAKLAKLEAEVQIWSSLEQFLINSESHSKFLDSILNAFEGLSKDDKKGSLFSLRFDFPDGSSKYIADFITFQSLLLASGTQDKSEKYGVKSEGYNKICSICLTEKPVIYGFASPFKYFTVDKPGFVSGFFNQTNTWKNYPICSDCSLPFELGRDYIAQNLQGYFYGRPFYALPKLLMGTDNKVYEKVLRKMKNIYEKASIAKSQKIERAEDQIMKLMGQEENFFNINLMFFEEDSKTKAIKIKLLLEEVLPSRFRKLFSEVPEIVNAHPFYEKAITVKKVNTDLVFNFGILKGFFEDDFLDLIKSVFDSKPLSREMVFTKFMYILRSNYTRQQAGEYAEPTGWTILKAHMTLRYFLNLNLLTFQKYEFMDTFEPTENKSSKFKYNEFKAYINQNPDFFDDDLKVGVFGLGMLVKYTMNIQYSNIKGTPFEKKLKGYDLSLMDLNKIYLEALDKLRQYGASGVYPELREQILPKFILNKHNPKKISKNELSLYFVAGLEWANQFKEKSDNSDQL